MNKVYQSISQNILNNVKNGWTSACINAEVLDGVVKLNGGYERDSFFTSFKFRQFDRRIINDFQTLHTITTEDSENKWNRALFSLEPTGKFNIEFEWDQDLSDEIERLNNESI